MNSDIRRQWQVAALAALLVWSIANLLGSVGQAADSDAGTGPDLDAIAERLDAMIERAAAQLRQRPADEGEAVDPNADAASLHERLAEAETQIRLLKNVVIQALRAQSEAEQALLREQAVRPAAAAEPASSGAEGPVLAEQVAALADSVRQLRADVDELRGGARGAAEPLDEDAMLPDAGMGGGYEPLSTEALARSAEPADGDSVKVAEVHFNTGSAQLTPGGEARTLEAVERIRSMAPARVRVVAFTDTVGDPSYNLVLSKERALSVAMVLENAGFSRDMVEVVGRGEDGVPVPTPDGVPEPLNRSAAIFVVRGHDRRRANVARGMAWPEKRSD